jgi:hypothetical protein
MNNLIGDKKDLRHFSGCTNCICSARFNSRAEENIIVVMLERRSENNSTIVKNAYFFGLRQLVPVQVRTSSV